MSKVVSELTVRRSPNDDFHLGQSLAVHLPHAAPSAGFSGRRSWNLLWLLWKESRPIVQIIFCIRFCVGALAGLTNRGVLSGTTFVWAAAWICLTLSIYLANGYSDQAVDVRNGSHRPLAEGRMSPTTVLTAAVLLATTGELALAGTRQPTAASCGGLLLLLGWCYSLGPVRLKDTVAGTAIASAGGGLLTYAAGSLATGVGLRAPDASILATLAMWMAVAGASKDLADAPGDRAAGRKTLPVIVGVRRACSIIAVGSAVLGAAGVAYACLWYSVIPPASALSAGAVLVTYRVLHTPGATRRSELRLPYRAFMITQYAANVAMLVTCAVRLLR